MRGSGFQIPSTTPSLSNKRGSRYTSCLIQYSANFSTPFFKSCAHAGFKDIDNKHYRIETHYHTRRAHRGAVIIRPGDGKDPLDLPKARLEALVKGIVWRDQHFTGKSFHQIATENRCSTAQVGKLIQQSFEIA